MKNLRGSRRLAAPPLSHWVPAALAAAPRQGFLGSFGPRAVKSVTTHFQGVSLGLHLPSQGLQSRLGGLRAPAPRAKKPRFVRSSRDFKALPRDAPSSLLRLPREAHKIPAFPARAPQTLRNAIPLRGTQGGGQFTLTLIFLRRSRKKASCPFCAYPSLVSVLAPTPSRAHLAQ